MAIVAADVAGYSRLVGADEARHAHPLEGTLARTHQSHDQLMPERSVLCLKSALRS